MYNFKDYLKGCKSCVDLVDKALSEDIVLSKEEKLDYYFKTLLFYREELKQFLLEPMYRVAKFYSKVFFEVRKIDKYGYSNDSAVSAFKRINRSSLICNGVGSSSVYGEDEDGTLFIYVDDLKDRVYDKCYKIYDRDTLMFAMVDYAQYLVSYSKYSSDFTDRYMLSVLDDVIRGVEPQPYLNMSESQTLGFALSKKGISSKVTYFKILGGDSDGWNGRDVFERRGDNGGLRGAI